MTHVLTLLDDGTTRVQVDFADEGVDLQGTTHVKGDETAALRYLPTFERDLRSNYAHLFPAPPEPEHIPEVEM
jgi:hypothetical protein